ncbi:ABC transporter permease subunit [Terrilactibacillus sp. BCM23-1]|uniref:ABC transporter permease subunit n=1 Tax=Terrilactibacillus tamarindi TaxID=2599694 RepID=A0A6N8CQE2_9BACI|nr:ABC transporter permease [Terrilactibacillus tamarindi]MTT32352.1 ABC transporter permease subunit [Terrilactibacillus tamarindi]
MEKSEAVASVPLQPDLVKDRVSTSFKRKSKRNTRFISGLILPIVVVILWQTVSSLGWVTKIVLPSPLAIILAAKELILSGVLFTNLKISLVRAVFGFIIGGGLGLALGSFVGLSSRSEKLLDPSLQMLRTIPHLAISPLFILWFGIGEESKVLLIALGAFFPLYVNTFLGIRRVDAKLFAVSQVLEFSKFKQLKLLIIPAALPNILLGLRLSLGAAWLSLVVAELMGSTAGIGYMMLDARQFSNTDIVFVGIIIFAIVGKLTDSLVKWIEKHSLKWQDTYKG